MIHRIFSALLLYLVLPGCEEQKESNFNALTGDEKRLPENALSSMKVASGLEVNLFASEPMVTNPTNISVDEKGRVWICESYNYDVSPEEEDKQGDRIIVLEDTDGNGTADKRTIFYQSKEISTPIGITAAGNQVYVTNAPHILLFSDTDGDLVADKIDTLFTNLRKGEHSAHSMFPGPDGMLYFSMGNYTGDVLDARGNPVRDKAGFAVAQRGNPYFGGMVTRFRPDGTDFEVLGYNFRNNYEPCIDAFGNIWQSDNDDDGNASCRINFVMPYGNYGFYDEMTGASWSTHRIGLEEKISDRHWHQHDPGVVPNVAITGAGSPAGMTIYEGDLLPAPFRGMPVHAEPYYNVVRAYVTRKEGAGYSMTIADILKSEDQWFRPVDVATAPDGSLFIADWYDPILGGGAAADALKGRIYRIAPDASEYSVPKTDLSNVRGAIAALKNPNMETRYLAHQFLLQGGADAEDALMEMWTSEHPAHRARALWLLARGANGDHFLMEALQDKDPDIRIAAIRAVLQNKTDVVPFFKTVIADPDPQVRREIATSLRYTGTPEAATLWLALAEQYDGNDRWYLEALGIGADLHADLFFESWMKNTSVDLQNKSHQDIIWRTRSPEALPLLADLIKSNSDLTSSLRYFRAFDFHKDTEEKNRLLLSLTGLSMNDSKKISALALQQIDEKTVGMSAQLKSALEDALQETSGTISFIKLVEKFNVSDRRRELLDMAIRYGDQPEGSAASDVLLKFGGADLIRKELYKTDSAGVSLLNSLKGKNNREILNLLTTVVEDSSASLTMRQTAVRIMGSSWSGEEKLLSLVKQKTFPEKLKPAAAAVLFNVYRSEIQREVAMYLPSPVSKENKLPTIKELLASGGNVNDGKAVFLKYCSTCHISGGEGKKFGPPLTHIATKMSKEGLYRSIIFPDEGISFGYESYSVSLQDGTEAIGIISSETDSDVELLQPGPIAVRYAKSEIKRRERNERSLMPPLASAMSTQELVDLVEYLASQQ